MIAIRATRSRIPWGGFRRFSAFFKKHFDVVSLREMLDDLELGRPIRGKLAITFDDGHRDNYTTAAPILLELGLPATFFIATGFIGTDRVPWWDEEAGIQSEWMSWDDVRASVDLFAFPYGREEQLSEENRELVRGFGTPVRAVMLWGTSVTRRRYAQTQAGADRSVDHGTWRVRPRRTPVMNGPLSGQ